MLAEVTSLHRSGSLVRIPPDDEVKSDWQVLRVAAFALHVCASIRHAAFPRSIFSTTILTKVSSLYSG